MWVVKYCVLISFAIHCYALNCHSDSGPKDDELKTIYKKCLKKQEGNDSSRFRNDDDSKEPRRNNRRTQWDKRDGRIGSGDERSESGVDDRYERQGRDDMTNSRYDRNRDDTNNRDYTGNSDNRMNRDSRREGSNNMMGSSDNRYENNDQVTGRDSFSQNNGYGNDMSHYNYGSSQASQRYKREKRIKNSGQRSQYNPNSSQKSSDTDSFRNEENNNTENSSKSDDTKACALHCFLENLEMIGDDGMPDRYLVTHAITKDVKNEDLRDFLQESIEECFQILHNENSEDKCQFSKDLMMCLSEKGRANCDDWKDDLQF